MKGPGSVKNQKGSSVDRNCIPISMARPSGKLGNCNVVAALELESKDGSSTFSGWMEAGLTVLSGDGTSEEAVSSKIISEVKSSSWSERLSLCGASSPEEQVGSEP
ncbi:Hypothetical predicted protein [Podarcis lilfordi]|uniref:Uncharacterized protein n=1 Tax=Podarcis lilfordi TaxID=74358 RepID=A0AA35K293_9SAUR|nr:Hypothetical predicted protein [Podarcis lilfordi]